MEGMKKIASLFLILFAVVISGCSLPGQESESVACTLEAKLCSDGSAVVREGPNCEFAECPPVTLCNDGSVCPFEIPSDSIGVEVN